jgi:hypothetical protein
LVIVHINFTFKTFSAFIVHFIICLLFFLLCAEDSDEVQSTTMKCITDSKESVCEREELISSKCANFSDDHAYSVAEEKPLCHTNKDCFLHPFERKDDHDLRTETPESSLNYSEDPQLEKVEESREKIVSASSAEVADSDDELDLPLNAEDTRTVALSLNIKSYKYERGRAQSSMIADEKELKLKCIDEVTEVFAEKKQKEQPLPDKNGNVQPLDLSQFLKWPAPKVIQVQKVYMLHSHDPLRAPIAESMKSTTSGDPSFPEGCHKEFARLATFAEYPHDCPVFVTKIARDGFLYRSDRQTIDCNFCRLSIPLVDLYTAEADPLRTHRRLKPDCPIIRGEQCGDIPVPPVGQHGEFQGLTANTETTPKPALTSAPTDSVGTASLQNRMHGGQSAQYQVGMAISPSPTVQRNQPQRDTGYMEADSTPSIEQPREGSLPSQRETQAYNPEPARREREQAQTNANPSRPSRTEASLPAQSQAAPVSNNDAARQNNTSSSSSARSSTSGSNSAESASQPASAPASNKDGAAAPKEKKKLTYSDLGIFADKPKRADMAVMMKRVQSFAGKWNPNYTQKPEMLADAGMYYAGKNFSFKI